MLGHAEAQGPAAAEHLPGDRMLRWACARAQRALTDQAINVRLISFPLLSV